MYTIDRHPVGAIEIMLELGFPIVRFEIAPNQYSFWASNQFTPTDEKQGNAFHYVNGRDITSFIESIHDAQGIPANKRLQMQQQMAAMKPTTCQLDKSYKWIQYLT